MDILKILILLICSFGAICFFAFFYEIYKIVKREEEVAANLKKSTDKLEKLYK